MMSRGFRFVKFAALGADSVSCRFSLTVALVVETSNKLPRCCGKFIECKELELVGYRFQSGTDESTVLAEGAMVLQEPDPTFSPYLLDIFLPLLMLANL